MPKKRLARNCLAEKENQLFRSYVQTSRRQERIETVLEITDLLREEVDNGKSVTMDQYFIRARWKSAGFNISKLYQLGLGLK